MTAKLTRFNGQYYLVDGNDVRRLSQTEYDQQKAQRDLTQNMSQGEQLQVGMGKGYSDMLSGIRQLTYGDPAAEREFRRQSAEGYAPMDLYGSMMGDVGQFAASASTGLIPGPRLAQTGYGATQGMAENPNNPLAGAFIGGASALLGDWAGDMLGRMAGRMASKRIALSAEKNAVIEAAEKEGLIFRADQKQQGTQARLIAQLANKNPIFAGIDETRWIRNQTRLNQLAGEFLGIKNVDSVTGEVIAKAYDASKAGFKVVDNYKGPITVNPDGIIREWDELTPDGEAFMKTLYKKYPKVFDGEVSGKEYMQARNWAAKVMRQKPELAEDINAIIGVMDDGLEESMDLATRQAVQQARKGWLSYLTMRASQKSAQAGAAGDVSPFGAYRALERYYGNNFVFGRLDDPFANAVRGMAAAGDTAPPTPPSLNLADILNPVKLLQQNMIEKPLIENYMQGGKLSEFLIGSSVQEPARRAAQTGAGVGRGLMYDEEN